MQYSIFGYDLTISELIALGCSLFLTVFYAVKTHGLKNIIKEVLEGMKNYKFKTEDSVTQTEGQTFPTTKVKYRLNKATGELEDTGERIDLQEIINSCLDTALDRVLEILSPKIEETKDVIELANMRDDLDIAMEACDIAEQYREKLELDDSMSVVDVFNEMAKRAEILDERVKTAKAVQDNLKKDFKENKDETAQVIKESE